MGREMGMNPRAIGEALAYGARADGALPLFREAGDPDKWHEIKNSPYGRRLLGETADEAEPLLRLPLAPLPYSLFKLFRETGSRKEYEREYFARRTRLSHLALLALAHGDRRYLEALEDTIWAICEEFTWCLPAHLGNTCPRGGRDLDDQARALDLFSTETGFALAEIVTLLERAGQPGLARPVAVRTRAEVYRRILEPYSSLSQPLWWESAPMNWAAVCAGSIGAAAMYLIEDEDRLALLLHRVLKTMACYLAGFGADGVSTEGVSYWSFGFGYFTYFAALLKERTNGKIDLFRDGKVGQIALFPQRCRLTGNHVVSFADCPLTVDHPPGLLAYLQGVFPEIRVPGPQSTPVTGEIGGARWVTAVRNLVWGAPKTDNDQPAEKGVFFPEAQWLIAHQAAGTRRIGFAAKGGHNDEPHNHNDLGSFIIHADGDTLLADPGRGEYTRQYFGPERYRFFATSSRGHSVPIVEGCYQQEGREHKAKVLESRITAAQDVLVLELAAAYGNENLRSLVRKFIFIKGDAPRVVLEDEFVFARLPRSLTERLVSLVEPVMASDGRICLEGANSRLTIEYPRRVMHLETGKEVFATQEAGERTVYLMDLVHDHAASRLAVRLEFLFRP